MKISHGLTRFLIVYAVAMCGLVFGLRGCEGAEGPSRSGLDSGTIGMVVPDADLVCARAAGCKVSFPDGSETTYRKGTKIDPSGKHGNPEWCGGWEHYITGDPYCDLGDQ